MRFLADVGISLSTLNALRNEGHDVVHLREQGLQRITDDEILRKARVEFRIILTFDLDFSDLLALNVGDSPSVIIFRLRDQTPSSVNPRLLKVLDERSAELEGGALMIIEEDRYRMRRLPIER